MISTDFVIHIRNSHRPNFTVLQVFVFHVYTFTQKPLKVNLQNEKIECVYHESQY